MSKPIKLVPHLAAMLGMTEVSAETFDVEIKKAAKKAGFYVENMGRVHGKEYAGQYRFMNHNTDEFQDAHTSDSRSEAWNCCVNYILYQRRIVQDLPKE